MASTFTVKTAAQVRDDILRVVYNGQKARGVTSPNIAPGSDEFIRASSLGNELESVYAGVVATGENSMPDSATDDGLTRWLAVFGIALRAAGPSTGKVVLDSTASTLVPTGAQLLDPTGQKFAVTTGGTYADGDSIPIQSVAFGIGSNLAGGTVLRWVSAPAYASPTAALDTAGTSGGVDAEDPENGRKRLLDRFANPPGGGNASQVAGWAEAADVSIEKAFVYPACNGPGTVHVALAGAATSSTSRSRVVAASAVTAATNAIIAEIPEYVELVCTSVADERVDVAFALTLPDTSTASAGIASSWVDAAPWPSTTGITTLYCSVNVVTSTTAISVWSATAPVVGQSISWVSSSDFRLYTAKILTSTTTSPPSYPTPGLYAITLDTPFTGIVVDDYVFPACANAQVYLDAVLAAFAGLGPGEKTNVAGVLPMAYRRPRRFQSYDYMLAGAFTKALSEAGAEVLDVAWNYRTTTSAPTLPTAITDAPNVFAPRRIGFYAP